MLYLFHQSQWRKQMWGRLCIQPWYSIVTGPWPWGRDIVCVWRTCCVWKSGSLLFFWWWWWQRALYSKQTIVYCVCMTCDDVFHSCDCYVLITSIVCVFRATYCLGLPTSIPSFLKPHWWRHAVTGVMIYSSIQVWYWGDLWLSYWLKQHTFCADIIIIWCYCIVYMMTCVLVPILFDVLPNMILLLLSIILMMCVWWRHDGNMEWASAQHYSGQTVDCVCWGKSLGKGRLSDDSDYCPAIVMTDLAGRLCVWPYGGVTVEAVCLLPTAQALFMPVCWWWNNYCSGLLIWASFWSVARPRVFNSGEIPFLWRRHSGWWLSVFITIIVMGSGLSYYAIDD